jgi:hypothetical protein
MMTSFLVRLVADDALVRQGIETRFRVRETREWKTHAADIEREMLKRRMMFDVIDRSQDQAVLPFQARAPNLPTKPKRPNAVTELPTDAMKMQLVNNASFSRFMLPSGLFGCSRPFDRCGYFNLFLGNQFRTLDGSRCLQLCLLQRRQFCRLHRRTCR